MAQQTLFILSVYCQSFVACAEFWNSREKNCFFKSPINFFWSKKFRFNSAHWPIKKNWILMFDGKKIGFQSNLKKSINFGWYPKKNEFHNWIWWSIKWMDLALSRCRNDRWKSSQCSLWVCKSMILHFDYVLSIFWDWRVSQITVRAQLTSERSIPWKYIHRLVGWLMVDKKNTQNEITHRAHTHEHRTHIHHRQWVSERVSSRVKKWHINGSDLLRAFPLWLLVVWSVLYVCAST